MPASISILRRTADCNGWQCFTAAEQFGIIFSSIVVFLVMSLVYMYCLGKAVTYRRTRESIEPSQQIIPRVMVRHAAANVPIPLPTRHPTSTLFVPAYCNQIAIPYAQSYANPVVLRGVPVAAPTNRRDAGQSMPGFQPSADSSVPGCQQDEQGRNTVDPNMAAEHQTMSPRWRQLLSRVLRLPTGKARTIYSESNPSSPRDTGNETGGGHANFAQKRKGQVDGTDEQEEHHLRTHSAKDRSADDGCEEAEAGSITTNAATVHSDDFQMLSPPSSIDLEDESMPIVRER
ncbi:hypothetical protein E4U55_005362 [Claviceps digitariae]|nr:hypothetical protein E4U55_005362 [Claviceps digitariae]